jgi:hypothetical protein
MDCGYLAGTDGRFDHLYLDSAELEFFQRRKTWEGEMAMVTMPGAIPDKFLFSVRDEKVAERINKFAGKRVALVYEQHKGLPTSCFGDTEYFIVDVKAIE